MCTIAMLPGSPGHLLLAGNRDELLTRGRARPPGGPVPLGEVNALFPVDADAGGTWIGANDAGLAMTLLNNYQASAAFTPRGEPLSRGAIIGALLEVTALEAARDHLHRWLEGRLERLRPFVLAIGHADPTPRALVARWDGDDLSCEGADLPLLLVSSSVALEEATRRRLDALAPLTEVSRWDEHAHPEEVSRHFAQCAPTPGPFTVCMAREDARTVSHTRVEVTPERVRMVYFDGPPCEDPPRVAHDMARRR